MHHDRCTVYNLVIILIIHYSCKIDISILYFLEYYVSLFSANSWCNHGNRRWFARKMTKRFITHFIIKFMDNLDRICFCLLVISKNNPKSWHDNRKSWDAIMIKCDMLNVYPQIISLFLSPDILQILSWKNQYGAWMKIQRRNWKFAIFHDLI